MSRQRTLEGVGIFRPVGLHCNEDHQKPEGFPREVPFAGLAPRLSNHAYGRVRATDQVEARALKEREDGVKRTLPPQPQRRMYGRRSTATKWRFLVTVSMNQKLVTLSDACTPTPSTGKSMGTTGHLGMGRHCWMYMVTRLQSSRGNAIGRLGFAATRENVSRQIVTHELRLKIRFHRSIAVFTWPKHVARQKRSGCM